MDTCLSLSPTQEQVIKTLVERVKEKMSGDGSGHDWWHVYRVWQNAIVIGQAEGADMFVVQAAALLHDIADWKFNNGDTKAGGRVAGQWLNELGVESEICEKVSAIIDGLSFKGAGVDTTMPTLEGKVVQDADRLEAIGAMGIARTFAYGGHKGRPIYDPTINPEKHETFEQYKNSNGPSINHFYEKLLLVKDLISTNHAKKLAKARHEYMENFLKQFLAEWDGQR
ncbi:MAG: HD domain-containing protein [Candidatus Obscuribacterales bacterium]|nr:HD domain-containing protein [Candidatus Obscuribacterales bacterium]